MELLYVYYVLVFYFGTILGSFLNVVALDIQKVFTENHLEERNELSFFARHISQRYFWKSLLSRRSHCDSCDSTLQTFELFPIFSYLLQRGKCTSCKTHIDSSHLWVEIVCGVYFLGIFYTLFWKSAVFSSAFIWTIVFWFVFFGLLFVLALFDYRTQFIPDVLLVLAGIIIAVYGFVTHHADLMNHLVASVLFAMLFYAVWFFSRGQWIGFADGKLAAIVGLLFGFSAGFTALAVSFWAGATVCVLLLVISKMRTEGKKMAFGTAVPFGPFMVFGMWYVFVFGLNLFQINV